jgi:hypothetical protein
MLVLTHKFWIREKERYQELMNIQVPEDANSAICAQREATERYKSAKDLADYFQDKGFVRESNISGIIKEKIRLSSSEVRLAKEFEKRLKEFGEADDRLFKEVCDLVPLK